jgi:hypothetical protein
VLCLTMVTFSGVPAQRNNFPVRRELSLLPTFAIRLAEHPPDEQSADSKCETYHHDDVAEQRKDVHDAKNINTLINCL